MKSRGGRWVWVGLVSASAGCDPAPAEQAPRSVDAAAPTSVDDAADSVTKAPMFSSARPTATDVPARDAGTSTGGAVRSALADAPSDTGQSRANSTASDATPQPSALLSHESQSATATAASDDAAVDASTPPAPGGEPSTSLSPLGSTEAGVDTESSTFDAAPAASTESSDGGAATLTSLQFFGAHAPLYPEFTPERSLYSLIAEANGAVLSVLATATGSVPLHVNGAPLVGGELTQLSNVLPGTALVFTLGEEPDAPQYVVQYLPPNFPQLSVENPAAGASEEPLYISLLASDATFIAKLDSAGVPLFYKEGAANVYDFKKHSNGSYSYAEKRSSTRDGSYRYLLDEDFHETGQLSSVGLVNTDVHDFLILPNGNHVFIAEEPAEHDLSAFGLSSTQKVRDGMFQEVNANREVVFQWNSWDHVRYDESVYAFEAQDYAHLNSIELDHDDHWLLSSRGFSTVFKIDRVTGAVIWRLGGISSDFAFVDDPYGGFCGQHTAHRLDNGHLLLLDNARDCLPEILGARPDRSRAVEYALDEDAMTARVVWSYERDGLVADSQGSAQRLRNGNTLIGWGSGTVMLGTMVLATEVTPSGDVVYELVGRARNNSRLSTYRARRFAD